MLRASPEEITNGSVPRVLAVLAAPLVLQNLVHVVNAIVDTFWLGRLGEAEVAAVGLNFPVISIAAVGIVLVAVGTQIALAQRVGAERHEEARRLGATGIVASLVVGIVVSAAFILAADPLMSLLADTETVASLAVVYLSTLMAFYPLAFVSDTVENAFIGWGDAMAAMYINLAMVGTNVVLDPFLIFGWGPFPALGVQGAAIASGTGFAVALALGLAFALGSRGTFTLERSMLSVDRESLREIVAIGTPLSGQRAASDIVRVAIIGLVSVTAGAAGVAAFTVGARVATLAFVPAMGLQQAAQAMIGQNLGAERPGRAFWTTATGVVMAGGVLAVVGAVQWLYPAVIVDVLVPDLTPRGRELSILYLQILALSYWAIGVSYLLIAGFNGASLTRTSFVADLIKYWAVRLPIAIVAIPTTVTIGLFGIDVSPGLDLGIEAIFWAVTVSNVLAAVGLAAYFGYRVHHGLFDRAAARIAGA